MTFEVVQWYYETMHNMGMWCMVAALGEDYDSAAHVHIIYIYITIQVLIRMGGGAVWVTISILLIMRMATTSSQSQLFLVRYYNVVVLLRNHMIVPEPF